MWMKVLKSFNLSREEEKIIQHYDEHPESQGFLPMAQLLHRYHYRDEAIEILMAGVAAHPSFTVARVLLVSYLWQKGLFVVAWRILQEAARGSLEGNILAWSLTFKLALVLGYEKHARTAMACLQASPQDQKEEIQEIIRTYTLSGLKKARESLLADYDVTALDLPGGLPVDEEHDTKAEESPKKSSGHVDYPQSRAVEGASCKEDSSSDECATAPQERFDEFHTVALGEIFSPADQGTSTFSSAGVELDSLTLAEIFEKQHCHAKALAIYRRLSSHSPGHDGLRKKILLLEKKIKDEQSSPLEDVDELIDSLQEHRIIDEKRLLLQRMLETLQAP